ncbi:tRNA 2'-phosphotransferase 1 [Mizuhopecten yessoensis]|uniref:tRNA 2'-phosphotransferase 1 n=1 Tax=Mizuhopecten yessoensis TaxID=6573 RepID=A0A210QZ38_MIZYE|nr:tRNA 2'-phosphotransferase 1 [Mizuhopecten yessoensis]
MIRTCGGHTTDDVNVADIAQTEIDDWRNARYCVHGTTKSAYEVIKKVGLSRMTRRFIHFAHCKAAVKPNTVVLIHLDIRYYLSKGCRLYRLANGTIGTAGNSRGMIKPAFFNRVQFL